MRKLSWKKQDGIAAYSQEISYAEEQRTMYVFESRSTGERETCVREAGKPVPYPGRFEQTDAVLLAAVEVAGQAERRVVSCVPELMGKISVTDAPDEDVLADARKRKKEELAEARWNAEVGGVEFGGCRMHTDRESQAKYTGAVVTLTATGIFPPNWKGIDGWLPIPDKETLLGLATAVQNHIGLCFLKEAELEAQADAVTVASAGSLEAALETIRAVAWAE